MDSDDKKVTQLTTGVPISTDIMPYVSDPGGINLTKKTLVSSISKGYVVFANSAIFSPTDATTYYFGSLWTYAPTNSDGAQKVFIPVSGVLDRVFISVTIITTYGSTELSSIYLRKNSTTDYLLSSVFDLSNNTTVNKTGLTVSVTAGDYVEIKWITPTWATNPAGLLVNATIHVS